MWSCGRYSSLVCVVSGHLCVLGLWVVLFPEAALFVSRRLFMSVCPPGTSARFGNVPGAGAFGGFDSPAGLWLRLLLLLARDVQSVVSSLRSSVVLRAVPPPLVGVRCFRCLWVWGVLVALIKLVGFLVGLRLWAAPSGCAFGLRLRAAPSGFAFGPARSHDSTQNPWAMPGVVPGFPTKHPRQTAVVLTAKSGRAVFWSVSCCTCCACPHFSPVFCITPTGTTTGGAP